MELEASLSWLAMTLTPGIAARLSAKCSVQVARVPDGSQPDQLSCFAIRRLLANVK